MDIIIGRDLVTSKLKLRANGNEYLFGTENSVPQKVSDQHFRLSITPQGITLENLDINNYTYVNDRAVELKKISLKDKIELSEDHYTFLWDSVSRFMPADIRPLEIIWNEYNKHRIDQQIADRRFNSLRSVTGLITMIAIALSFLTGKSWGLIALYAAAIIISLAFTIKAWKDASAVPQKAQLLDRQFQHDYVCPHCGHFLGNQSYEIIVQNGYCPYCKSIFIH